MIIGPVFTREVLAAPRRPQLYIQRTAYVGILFGVMCTSWLVLTGTQVISNLGDLARFGNILFQLLAPLQLAIMVFFAALSTASAVAHEKDRRTLILLLLTRLNNSELVLGKLFASLLHIGSLLIAGLPVFAFVMVFGGVSFTQVGRVLAVTSATALVAGSLGSTLALWREKTFQTLALTAVLLVVWMLLGEGLHAGALGEAWGTTATTDVAAWVSPVRAIFRAAHPSADLDPRAWFQQDAARFVALALGLAAALNGLAIVMLRRWNPSREIQPIPSDMTRDFESDQRPAELELTREARTTAVPTSTHRLVWEQPILWREVCTWAYGRKMIAIRLAYVVFFMLALAGVYFAHQAEFAAQQAGRPAVTEEQQVLAPTAWPVLPFFLVSLVLVNALAVTSITQERDGRCLDLLLVTDLTPREFLFGKLGGVAWVTKEMIFLPLILAGYLWWLDTLSLENLLYVAGGLLVMDLFVAMLGIHCGMTYANSRSAIGISLGTAFFLFLGVATCIVMMISFSGSFQVQLAPFLTFILGGWVGLYVTLGKRNPSPAIGLASFVLPFATFYAITSFLMNYTLAVFVVTALAYSFTTAAMMIPALSEFDFAQGRGEVPAE